MSELRIRVKPNVKTALETIKEERGFSINFQVNFAIFKYLVLDTKIPLWKLDDKPDPHYEYINKLPEELKYCDGDSCEIEYGSYGTLTEIELEILHENEVRDEKKRGDKC